MTGPTDTTAIADAYLAAWNSRDVEAILAMHSQDSTFEVHGRTAAASGLEELRTAFAAVFDRYPNFRAEVHRLRVGPRHWALDWTLHFGTPSTGPRQFHCLDVVEVSSDGLVTRKDTFYNYPEAQAATSGVQ